MKIDRTDKIKLVKLAETSKDPTLAVRGQTEKGCLAVCQDPLVCAILKRNISKTGMYSFSMYKLNITINLYVLKMKINVFWSVEEEFQAIHKADYAVFGLPQYYPSTLSPLKYL